MDFLTGPRHTAQVFWFTSKMLLLLSMESPVPKLPSKDIDFERDINQNKDDHDRESFPKSNSREVLQEGGRAMDAALAALFCNGRYVTCYQPTT